MVIGGDRSGTRWPRSLCEQHPDIYFCPVRQREFLSKQEVVKRRLFTSLKFNCPTNDYRGEKIVLAMRNVARYHPDKVAKMYFSYNKNMKFLLSVRNPIDRTFSQYVGRMHTRIKRGDVSTTYDINKELGMEQPHVQKSLIYSMLEPYLDLFPAEQFFIYPYELMLQDTEHWLNKVFAFLGVTQDIPLHDISELANPGKYDVADFVPVSAESKRHLIELCMEDIEGLSELSGIDLVELWGLKSHLQGDGATTSPRPTQRDFA